MSNKILVTIFIFIVQSLLVTLTVDADSYEESGEDSWAATTYTAGSEEDDSWGDAGTAGQSSTVFTEDDPGFSLYLGMRIYCHNSGYRETENAFVARDDYAKESYIFIDDFLDNIASYDVLFPFLPYDSDYSKYSSSLFDLESGLYTWTSEAVKITTSSDDPFVNAKIHRFEGETEDGTDQWPEFGCIPFVGATTKVGVTNAELGTPMILTVSSKGEVMMRVDTANTGKVYAVAYPYIGYNVNWDGTKTDCEAIRGAWTEEDAFTGYRCCGDDRMWIDNKAVNEEDGFIMPTISDDEYDALGQEDGTTRSSYCLYGARDDGQEQINIQYIDQSADTYNCARTGFESYDFILDKDNNYDDEATDNVIEKEDTFIFQGSNVDDPEYETDIGKWSDSSGLNPQFCYYEYNETTIGEEYYWMDINEAGDKPVDDEGEPIKDFNNDHADTICEKYLGGTWTGSHCCGNKYDYEDQSISWYDSDYDVGYIDESFSADTPIYYEGTDEIIHNYACVEGNVIESVNAPYSSVPVTAQKTGTEGEEYELLNVNGTLYGCNIVDPSVVGSDWYTQENLITSKTNAGKCDVIENTYLCNYDYNDLDGGGYQDDQHWEWYHVSSYEEGEYVAETLGYSKGDIFEWSEPGWATEDQQQGACCAGNRCWDGDKCVDEYTEYSYDSNDDGIKETDICFNGSWEVAETKYDWYHNTDGVAINYCVNQYACICSSNEEDDTFCTENEAYLVAGCTVEPSFYKDDHYCEAINLEDTDSDGAYDRVESSRWTSRTKFLAFQLIQIAQDVGTGFTLFCDRYSNTLNNYVTVEAIAEDINSFCILSQDGEVVLGLTFNSNDDNEPMTVDADDLLFDSNGFVNNIIDNDNIDFSDCNFATDETIAQQTAQFGEYYSCDGSTQQGWYNTVLNAFIYSNNGLSAYSTTLDYPDTEILQDDILETVKSTITAHINTATNDGTLVNQADQDLEAFDIFSYVEDYSSFYYSKENSVTIIGFEDLKYNGESGNRHYLGVLYDGLTLDCNQFYAQYETTASIYCNTQTGIVLEKSTEGSEFWRSLTAGIRME